MQPRVQGLCYRVLRHEQDAEDAAQQAMLKISARASEFPDVRGFHAWVRRVALNCALDVRRSSRRRLEHERTAAHGCASPALETEDAIQEALATLDDDLRCLLVGHFYERRTLRELAWQEGCSVVAIWKRIEKAKKRLKQSLGSLGFDAFVPRVDAHLTALTGGVAMTKGTLTAVAVALAVACLGIGAGAGAAVQKRRDTVESPRGVRPVPRTVASPEDGTALLDSGALARDEEVARLNDRIRELEVRLEQRSGSKDRWPQRADRSLVAKEIFEEFLTLVGKSERQVDMLRVLRRLEEVDPAMVPFFIDRFRNGETPGAQAVGFLLALWCGGAEVERLVAGVLSDGTVAPEARGIALSLMGPRREGLFPFDKLALEGELGESLLRGVGSADARVRGAAARLLETQRIAPDMREPACAALLRLVMTEADSEVRHAAYRALLRVGDPATIEYIKSRTDFQESLRPQK